MRTQTQPWQCLNTENGVKFPDEGETKNHVIDCLQTKQRPKQVCRLPTFMVYNLEFRTQTHVQELYLNKSLLGW